MIFNEVYVGQKPEIQKMCDIMSESRSLYMKKKVTASRKKLIELESLIEDFFGFGTFCIDLMNDPEINACTYPVGVSLDVDPTEALYTTSANGYRFKKEAKLAAISRITTGLFGNPNFTDEEVFAIFLHEVGHSFTFRSPLVEAQFETNKMSIISTIIIEAILSIITLNPVGLINSGQAALFSTNFYKAFSAKLDKLSKKIPILRSIDFQVNKFANFVARGVMDMMDAILTVTGINYLVNKLNNMTNSVAVTAYKNAHPNAYNRSQERLSDDFVTTYGYGEQLATALIKLDNRAYVNSTYRKFQDNFPIINKIYKAQRELVYEYVWVVGAHPSSSDRILSIIENMEHDLKTDKTLSSKEKKVLEEQLKTTKKLANDTIKGAGEIEKNKDEYLKALTILGFKNGSTETRGERDYTDMNGISKRFDELHESSINMDILGWDFNY